MKKLFKNWDILIIAFIMAVCVFIICRIDKVDADYIVTGPTILKKEYVEMIREVADDYGVCPELVMAVCEYESGGNAKVVNTKYNCTGLMQVHPYYNRDRMKRLGVTDLKNPKQNILTGTDLLMELAEECDYDIAYTLMRYHGESKAKSNYENGYISPYAKKIMVRAEELERRYKK